MRGLDCCCPCTRHSLALIRCSNHVWHSWRRTLLGTPSPCPLLTVRPWERPSLPHSSNGSDLQSVRTRDGIDGKHSAPWLPAN